MDLERETFDGTAVVRCTANRLDAAVAVKFKDQFRAFSDEATKRFILEMSSVNFMDSSGLGAVVAVYKSLGDNTSLDLAGLTPPVERVFRLTKMDTIFGIFSTVDDALASNPA